MPELDPNYNPLDPKNYKPVGVPEFEPGTMEIPRDWLKDFMYAPPGLGQYEPGHADEKQAYQRYQGLREMLARLKPDRTTNDANNAMTAMRGAKVARRSLAGYGGLEGRPKANMIAGAIDPAMQNWAQANATEDARYSGLLNQMDAERGQIVNALGDNALNWAQTLYNRELRDRARKANIDWSNRQTAGQIRGAAVNAGGGLLEALGDVYNKYRK